MRINYILKKLGLPEVLYDHEVEKLCIDSRLCCFNSLFFALGSGKNYLQEALNSGAKTLVIDSCDQDLGQINVIITANPRKLLAEIAKIYYKDISKKIELIGVIGTNGKTTTSTIAYDFLRYVGIKAMLIGTSGIFYADKIIEINNTTPDIITIYEEIVKAYSLKIKYVIMEVSSISIDQFRTWGLSFKRLIFTNISQDHLDYHKTLEHYRFCKLLPFIKLHKNALAIVNADDGFSKVIIDYCDCQILTYGFESSAEVVGTANAISAYGLAFYAYDLLFKSSMLGAFNLYNLLSVLALLKSYGFSLFAYRNFLSSYQGVAGRMNYVKCSKANIIIDYAHTYEATKKAIEETKKICSGKLFIVLGCGGNRERQKRFMIGSYLDTTDCEIILTTDNPRFEEPRKIIADIMSTINRDVVVFMDRKEAILYALKQLNSKDYLLILGKGSEKYLEINGTKYPYSDQEVIDEWISAA